MYVFATQLISSITNLSSPSSSNKKNNREVSVLLRCLCGYPGQNKKHPGVKFCPIVYSVSVANTQVTNIGKCSIGFRGYFLNAQYNRTNSVMFSNKCCIWFFKMGTRPGRKIVSRLCVCS